MQATRKFKILDNRFSTVESLGKQIYQRDQQIDFNEVDVNTVGKSKQSALVDFIIKRTMAKNIVMCVDIYDINYKQQVLQEIKRIRDNKRSWVHPFDINRRAFSPQPKIALMSFSKDAFFNKREGILKPWLKIKKLKIFTNQLKKIEKLLNKNKTKRIEMNIWSIDKTSGNEVLMNSIKNYSNKDNWLPYSDNKADLNCTLYQDSQSKSIVNLNDFKNKSILYIRLYIAINLDNFK